MECVRPYEQFMTLLFEIHGFLYPMEQVWWSINNVHALGRSEEAEMLAIAVVTLLCTAGVAFYVLFLVALGSECRPRLVGYWMRLQPGAHENAMTELRKRRPPARRAA